MSTWPYHDTKDNAVFLFTLTNPHGIKPTKFPFKNIGYYSLGGGLYFYGGFGVNGQNCTFQFPGHGPYIDTTGKGSFLFTGIRETKLSDMEVFQCIR
jgi:hypothetical protein